MCGYEDRGVVSILENTGRWLWSFGLTFETEGFQTLTAGKSSVAKFC